MNTSIAHPSQGTPDRQEQGERKLTRNEQREALEESTPDRTSADDHSNA